jgi:outer membrane receptor protein involved in Fe transport
LGQTINFSQPEHTYSAFGSVTWNVTDRLKVGGGLRGSWVNKAFNWNLLFGTATQDYGGVVPLPASLIPFANALGLGTANTLGGTRTDRAWLPSAKIQFKVTPAAMVYCSYAKGFKAGGFNGADNSGVAANLPFGPEHVDAYEVGLKSEWFHDTVLLNFAAFRSDYSDLQVSENVSASAGAFVSMVKNAASSRSQGIEIETQWAVTRNFHLSANASYDDAHYVSYPKVTPTQLQQLDGLGIQDLSGRPTQFAPKWSGNLTGAYRAVLGAGYQLTTELTTLFSSSFFLSATDDPTARQDSYVRLDGRLSLATQDDRWAVDLIGHNLTNRDIAVFAVSWPLSLGSTFFQKEQSRNVALQLRYHW